MKSTHPSEKGEALSGNGDGMGVAEVGHSAQPERAAPSWFAVYTAPRHEKRIAEHFESRQIEYFLPLYRTPRKWKDRSKGLLDLPLFPGYIFVRVAHSERVRVLDVPGVQTIIGSGREPICLPEFEIECLRAGIHARNIEPHPLLLTGQRARIKVGAMAGMEGVVVRNNNNFRVVLTLELIMQSVAVEVDSADLEPLPPRNAAVKN